MKKYNLILLLILFSQITSFAQKKLNVELIDGCEKILMTIDNFIYLVNTSQPNFGREVTKYDYAKSTNESKRGQYTDGKYVTRCYHSVIDRYDENMDQVLVYMTSQEEIVEPLKEQLQSMKSHYAGREGEFMKYTFSYQGDKYDLFVKFQNETNVIKFTKIY